MAAITDPNDAEGPEELSPADPGNTGEAGGQPTDKQVSDSISQELLRIVEESYGRGAAVAETHVSDDWVIVVLDELELLPNEKFLVENGKQDTVIHVRHQYQQAIQDTFRAAVERATGRKVIGFGSTTSVEGERFMVEIFKLD